MAVFGAGAPLLVEWTSGGLGRVKAVALTTGVIISYVLSQGYADAHKAEDAKVTAQLIDRLDHLAKVLEAIRKHIEDARYESSRRTLPR